jgi:hypothetical protein
MRLLAGFVNQDKALSPPGAWLRRGLAFALTLRGGCEQSFRTGGVGQMDNRHISTT